MNWGAEEMFLGTSLSQGGGKVVGSGSICCVYGVFSFSVS